MKTENKLAECKAFVDIVETKSADLKDKFLFYSFAAFRTASMWGKAADCHVLLRMLRQNIMTCVRFV